MKRLCCPACGSTDIWAATGGYTGCIYRCKHCGYHGALVVEYDDEERDDR